MIDYITILNDLIEQSNKLATVVNSKDRVSVKFIDQLSSMNIFGNDNLEEYRTLGLTFYQNDFASFHKQVIISNKTIEDSTLDLIKRTYNDLAKECLITIMLRKSDLQAKIESGEIKVFPNI